MSFKTIYSSMEIYNKQISDYLKNIKTEEPTVSGSSVCHYTKDGGVLTEPTTNLKIVIMLDDKNPIFGDLEKLAKGEELKN